MGNFFQSVASSRPVAVNRFLDDQTDIAAFYSLRRLISTYSGPALTIRRDSDDQETDIYFDANDVVDVDAISEFCGSGVNGYVKVWYDQGPNGIDLSQTSTTIQPQVFDGSNVNTPRISGINTKPAINDSIGVSTVLSNSGFDAELSGGYSYFCVIDAAGYGDGIFLIDENGLSQVGWKSGTSAAPTHYHTDNSDERVGVDRSGYPNVGQTNAGFGAMQSAHFDGSTSASVFITRHDGYNLTGSKTVGSLPSTAGGVSISFPLGAMDRPVQELLVFSANKSSQRKEIESNINDYYTIGQLNYDLPLDTYTNAAVAYSVRKLRSDYTGYCMEVYNGTSYADIGFNELNELDVPAIASHCGVNDGFVSKWYSQGSSSNTAFQTDPTKMPQIYDGATGKVFMENGKPIIQNISGSYPRFQITNPVTGASSAHNFIVARQDGSINSIMSYGTFANENQGIYMSFNSGGSSNAGVDLHVDGVAQTNYSGKSQLWSILLPNTSPNIINSKQDYSSTDSSLKHFIGVNQDVYPMFSTQEIIIFDSAMDDDREAIENNQNAYFNVY